MTYSPTQDSRMSYEEAVRAIRAEYERDRQWIYEQGRWETALETFRRTLPRTRP